MKKAVIFNLGCKVNQYEADVMASQLYNRGYNVFKDLCFAELYIINTCAVTNEAERKSRQILARINKFNPDGIIIVCGCAAVGNKQFYLSKGVQLVSGVNSKEEILNFIDNLGLTKNLSDDSLMDVCASETPQLVTRTRAYVKIQDGCNSFCSYCLIPYLRGRSVSRRIEDIVKEIASLSELTSEIVLTGINLSYYGLDIDASLTKLILALRDIPSRIRLGSFYVEGINKELLTALSCLKHFCPHFHFSLQSGDTEVLKAMNRKYTAEDYLDKISLVKQYFPTATVTTDIIVGYPTETDVQFHNTLEFVKKIKFMDIHIFPYSKRQGTASYSLPEIDGSIINDRKKLLTKSAEILKTECLSSYIGKTLYVLFEDYKDTLACGYSDEYIRVFAPTISKAGYVNIKCLYKDGLKGELINE